MMPFPRVRLLIILAALGAAGLLLAEGLQAQQTGTITGRVTDTQSGQPIPSVQIFIEGLDIGVLTQQNGRYLLQNVPAGTHTVSAERIGYRSATAEVSIGAGETVVQNFSVAEEALQLDEVIVTGTPGGTQRRAIGNSVTQVDAAEVTERAAINNMQEMLSARTPGLNFTRLSGNVGEGSSINIRGFSSIQLGNQPLVYVDGVRMDNSFGEGPPTRSSVFFGPDNILGPGLSRDAQGASGSALDDLNPNDIESIEIIKGPAAATLYGTEASAGVIQIITKKGREGAPQFDFQIRQGGQWLMDPAGKIGPQYFCPDGNPPCNESELGVWNAYDHESRVAEEPFSYGYTQGYNLSVRGGTETIRYYVSGDWSDDTGIVSYNWDQSLALRSNLSVIFSENLTVDASVGYVDGDTRYGTPEPLYGGVWDRLLFADGHLMDGELRGFNRPLDSYSTVEATREFSRFTGSITATHNFGEWLTQRLIFGLDRNWTENQTITPRSQEPPNPFLGYPLQPFPGRSDGHIYFTRPIEQQFSFDYSATAQYDATDRLTFSTSVGAQYYADETSEVRMEAERFPSPLLTNLTTVAIPDDRPEHRIRENKSAGFYVQEQVGWDNRLFVTGAVRADDSSTFGSDFDLVYYPKVSAAWVVSEEDFWNVDFVNSLRLRAAWGESGRQPTAFAGVFQYDVETGPGGSAAVAPRTNRAGNPNLGPERAAEIEVGAEFALLDDRLSGEFTYFSQKVTDALVPQTLAPSEPFIGNFSANAGELKNWGWEASLNARVYQTENFAFDLNLAGDHTDNEITKLSDEILGDENFRQGWYYPNVVFITFRSADGVYDANGNLIGATNLMCDGGVDASSPGTAGGDALKPGGPSIPCSEAVANDKKLMHGRAFPSHTWSISPSFTFWNSLQVFGLVEGQFGRWLANIDNRDRVMFGQFDATVPNSRPSSLQQDPYWFGATQVLGATAIDDTDERYLGRFRADFWKLREVGLRYQLPQEWVQRAGADRASISVSGRNLWTIWTRQDTDFSGVTIPDPEQVLGFSGEPNFSYRNVPALSSASLTLRVSF